MDIQALLNALFRWIHIASGILWIGLLYWFNFVNIPFAGTMDGDTKKKVVPELLPRALYWFRWAAAYTWATGVILLFVVFYHGGIMYPQDVGKEWTMVDSLVLWAIIVAAVFAYDFLAKSAVAKNLKQFAAVGFVLIGIVIYLMITVGKLDYRSYVIHTGVLFGSIMAFNVWFRIWPSQKKVIAAVKEGTAPDPTLVSLAGSRSRTNTYLSVPLIWMMINMHTTTFAMSGPLMDTVVLLAVVLLGWLGVMRIYKLSAKVKGF